MVEAQSPSQCAGSRLADARPRTVRYCRDPVLPFREGVFQVDANSFARCFYAAIGNEPQGKVLVFDSAGYVGTSIGGGTKLSRLSNTGVAGLITAARLRDFPELAAYGPVFYCGGETVRAGTAELMSDAVNVPAVLAGVTVVPGDHVYADSSGTVIIPAKHFDEIWAAAIEIECAHGAASSVWLQSRKATCSSSATF